MTDLAALIAELRERAGWADCELNQALVDTCTRAADALEELAPPKGWTVFYKWDDALVSRQANGYWQLSTRDCLSGNYPTAAAAAAAAVVADADKFS